MLTEEVGGNDRCCDNKDGVSGRFHANGNAGDNVCRRPGLRGFSNVLDRTVPVFGIILSDENEGKRSQHSDHPGKEEVEIVLRAEEPT